MPRWVEIEDNKRWKTWCYTALIKGLNDSPVEHHIAFVEYRKEDPFGYRAFIRESPSSFPDVGFYQDLEEAKREAEKASTEILDRLNIG